MRDEGLQTREEQGAPADEAGAARHEDERVDALQPQRVCVIEPLVQRGAERGVALNACAFRPQRRRVDGQVERSVGQILDVLRQLPKVEELRAPVAAGADHKA